jgi:GxxExxY protein
MESYIFTTTELTERTERETDPLTSIIIGAAIDVHRELGPGLLESAYEACLVYELRLRKLKVEHQKPLPIFYKDVMLDCGYRLDLVIEHQVIVEIKSIHAITPLHEAQLLSYLKLSDYKRSLLINFNVKLLKDGIRRMKS